MKNKRILFIVGASYVSGLENITLHLIRGLKERGYEVKCVINGWNDGVFKSTLQSLGIDFFEMKLGWIYITKPKWTIDTLLHWPGAYFKFKKAIRSFDPDIIHFTNFAAPIMTYPLLRGRKCLYALHETHLPSKPHLLVYKLLNKKMNIFTAVSGHIVNVLRTLHIPDEKIRLVYNGVPAVDMKPLPADETTHIGIIGQIAEWKGHETLVDAAAVLQSQGVPPFKVQVFGNDTNAYSTTLKRRIEEKGVGTCFSWRGFVKDQDGIYGSLNSVVVPSLSEEPCSLTILEAMMRGKAVVVSGRGGNPELVDDGADGMIFKAGDAQELAECLSRLIKNRTLITTIGQKAREKALHAYTLERMVVEYTTIYEAM